MQKKIEKTLITCTPTEFLKQTMKLKRTAEKWLKDIEFSEIRKRLPKIDTESGNTQEAIQKQALDNLSAILENALEKYPEETLEILALTCFIEPEDIDKYPMREYLLAIGNMVRDEAVLSFFTSLVQLGQMFSQNQ